MWGENQDSSAMSPETEVLDEKEAAGKGGCDSLAPKLEKGEQDPCHKPL